MDENDDGGMILEQEGRHPVKADKGKPLAKVFSNPAVVPFGNYFNRKKIEGYTRVIDAENKLMSALREHEITRGRLKNIGKEVELDELDLQNRLAEAKRRASLSGKEDYLAALDMDLKIAEAEKRLAELKKPAGDDGPKWQKLKERLEQKLQQMEIFQDYGRRKKILNIMNGIKTKKDIEAFFHELVEQIAKGRDYEELNEKEKQELEDLQDEMDTILDKE